MKFYIVTPTFNSMVWLRRCVRSVADQVGEGVEVHHHIQDGGSGDGTIEWLRAWQAEHADTAGYTLSIESAADEGMYDALNKAWDKMPDDAEITAHLNSDEQYLPGALAGVMKVAEKKAGADMILGTYIVVDAEGKYHCHRRPVMPDRWLSITVCEIGTCACFYRTSFFRAHGVRFDTRYRSIGDLVFYHQILQKRPVVSSCPTLMVSACAMTGSNLAWTDATRKDEQIYRKEMSPFWPRIHGLSYRFVNARRRLVDLFCAAPRTYALYEGDKSERVCREISAPTCKWRVCGAAANTSPGEG